jgi:hypothetical protein
MNLREQYRGAFTKAEMIKAATVALVRGEFIRVGEYNVQAGELISIGYGMLNGQESATGRIFLDLKDSTEVPVQIDGTIRFVIVSPQDRPLEILAEYRSETLRTGTGDRTKQVPFAESDVWISEDKKLVMEVKADETATLSKANSTILFDVTRGVI